MQKQKANISHKRLAALVIVIIINGFVGFHLVANYIDWKIPYINPNITYPTQTTTQSIHYDYPPSNNSVPYLVIGANGVESGLPLFSLTITYTYDNTLAEGVLFYITASGSIYPEGQQTVDSVDVGYQETSWGDNSFRNYPPTYTANLHASSIYSMEIPPSGNTSVLAIKWSAEGDYYPYIHIVFNNGSTPIDVTLPDGKVHVYGLDTIQQEAFNRTEEDYNRRSGAMFFDGILFPLIDIPTIGGLVWKGKAEKNSTSDTSHTEPNKNKTYPEVQRQNPRPQKKKGKKR